MAPSVACIFLLTSASTSVAAFQIQTSKSAFVTISLASNASQRRASSRITPLAAKGGMDAYEAQLAAMNQPTTNVIDSFAAEMMNDSRATFVEELSSQSAVSTSIAGSEERIDPYETQQFTNHLLEATPIATTGSHGIGGLLLQRAIQTQLHYLADLRDEPTYVWLRGFLGHDHLDDKGRFNELDGLRCPKGWRGYLTQLERAPPFTIVVELAPPRLSAQQKRNPYLAKQAASRSYEETIEPSRISLTLRTVARSLEREWVPVLSELAAADRIRVHLFECEVPQLWTTAAAKQAAASKQRVAGGEGDDQDTPLHALNCRIVARFCTRVALHRIIEELEGVSLSVEAADGDDEGTKRMSCAAADAAAVQWLSAFSREWVPRLERGADDEVRRSLGVAFPGQWQRLCEGADADDVTEALWQELPQLFADVSDEAMRLYSPEALAVRLRRVRANVCDELVEGLRAAVANELR